jgi:hypothetical protein
MDDPRVRSIFPGHAIQEHALVRRGLPLKAFRRAVDDANLIEWDEEKLLCDPLMNRAVERKPLLFVEGLTGLD